MGAKRALRLVAAVSAAVLLVFLFAAPHEATTRKYPHRKLVRFWHMWSAEWKDVVDKIVDEYNESQDKYEVVALSVPDSADSKFLLGVMGGDPADVMAQWNPVIPTWAEGGLLTPFEDLMSPAEYAQFQREAYPVVKRIGLFKGKTYGIPIGVNVKAIFYLPKALKEAGIREFPKTWEDLVRDSALLTKRDKQGHITQLGFMTGTWAETASLFGGGFYDFDKNELTLDRPENLKCLESLVALRKRDGYAAVERFQAGLNTMSFSGGWPFIGGSYAAAVDGQWRVEQLSKYAPDLEYATAPIPPPIGGRRGAGLSNGNFMIVPMSAKDKEGAWDFIKFWSGLENPERAAKFYVKGGWLPLSDRITFAPIYQEYIRQHPQFQAFVDAVRGPDLRAQPPVAYQVFINDQIKKLEDMALRGDISPTDAVRKLTEAVRQEAARRKELGYDE